jgi:hypothetical protein
MAQIERQFIDAVVGDGRAQAWITINDATMRVTSVRYQNTSTNATLNYKVYQPDTLDVDVDTPTFEFDVTPGLVGSSNIPAGFNVKINPRDGVTYIPNGWKAVVSAG